MVIGTVKTDSLGANLFWGADGYRPGIGDHESPPVEHHECPLLAISRHNLNAGMKAVGAVNLMSAFDPKRTLKDESDRRAYF